VVGEGQEEVGEWLQVLGGCHKAVAVRTSRKSIGAHLESHQTVEVSSCVSTPCCPCCNYTQIWLWLWC
jgi:hypothetical protein